ncbi:MAG: molybdenum ABC transporter ATP-binding protein [Betaproteobacteria bacterium]
MSLATRLRLEKGVFRLDAALRTPQRGITALFGASGSGKTTLLRCIAGLERAAEGTVDFGGECWQDSARGVFVAPHRRRCGYVFQEASLFPHLSVRQNLRYGARRADAAAAVPFDATVHLLGLESLLDRDPAGLSGGERQRVAIARALLSSPRLLLMDEPLASLDASRKGELLFYIEAVRDELAIPIVYVSHSVDEVVRLADQAVLLAEGCVRAAGGLQDTIGRQEGSAIVEAVVVQQDLEQGLARLAFDGGELLASDLDALPGERVRVRIQARDVALALVPPPDSSFLNVVPATVGALDDAPGGVDVRVRVGARTVITARVTRRSAVRLALSPGKPVYALVKAVAIDRRSIGYA